MTGGVALAVFGGAVVVDWVAVGRGSRGAEYVAKPAASDALIAWNRFVRRLAWAPVVIMVTYHLGQRGL